MILVTNLPIRRKMQGAKHCLADSRYQHPEKPDKDNNEIKAGQ